MAVFLEEEISEEDMKSMKFHEMRFMDKGSKVILRTVGGFIYTFYKTYSEDGKKDKQYIVNTVFVPEPESWRD